jgi:adenylate cyclase class 2
MPPIETEVKFHLVDPPAMRARLIDLGALSSGRTLERNVCFDTEAHDLRRHKSLLRLRQDRRVTLTFKSPPAETDPGFKQLVELEVEVGDFEAMRRILHAVGFRPQHAYEKQRETLRLGRTAFCVDTLPYGDFLEIEGPRGEIRDCAGRLGVDWDRRILLTYLEIFAIVKSRLGLNCEDATFDNFNGIDVCLADCLPMMETGRRPASG